LAKRACELTNYRVTICIGTLSAAYAEAGNFVEAVKTSEQACLMAEKAEEQDTLQRNKFLLELFRKHLPYRESP